MTIGVDGRVLMDAYYSGVAEYTLNLLQALLAEDTVNDYVLFYNSIQELTGRLPQFKPGNVSVVRRHFPNKLLNYGLFRTLHWPRLDQLMGRPLDIFWMPHFNFMVWPRARNFLTVHDLSFLRYPEFFSARKNFWHSQFKPAKLIKTAERIIAISAHTKQDLVDLIGIKAEKVTVIHSGIVHDYQPLVTADLRLAAVKNKYQLPEKFILFLGMIEPRKNLVGLITAYDWLRNNYPDLAEVKLIIAGGNGWKFKEVYRAAAVSPYQNDIKFLGYVAAADKPALYNLASVFTFPSLYEGFGFPPLEAMASGTPVVASFAAALPEVLGEAAILVDPDNAADIGQALAQVLLNSELRQNLIQRGLKQAREFDWQKTAKSYLTLFNA